MPDGLRPSASPATKVLLRSPELSLSELEAIRKLLGHSMETVEREFICETLIWRGGNRTHAANVLGISIRALRNKIHRYMARGRSITPSIPSCELSDKSPPLRPEIEQVQDIAVQQLRELVIHLSNPSVERLRPEVGPALSREALRRNPTIGDACCGAGSRRDGPIE
jgi:hypothetical protein